jgi:hypothetical protein
MVNDVCKAWIGYGDRVYNSNKDPVMKQIWKEKEELEAILREKIAAVPDDQKLRAMGIQV